MEEWKSLEFLGYPNYQISDQGNVKGKQRLRKATTDRDGYKNIVLYSHNKGKNFKIHQLVALAFIPNPDNLPQVNHKDTQRWRNVKDNLEWITNKGNCQCNSNATITNEVAEQIRQDYSSIPKPSLQDLMVKYNTTYNIIQNVLYNKCWIK